MKNRVQLQVLSALVVSTLVFGAGCSSESTLIVEGKDYVYRIPKRYESNYDALYWLYGVFGLEGADDSESTWLMVPDLEVEELGFRLSVSMLMFHDRVYKTVGSPEAYLSRPPNFERVQGRAVRFPHYIRRTGDIVTRIYFSDELLGSEAGVEEAVRFRARIQSYPPYDSGGTLEVPTSDCTVFSVHDGILIQSTFSIAGQDCGPQYLVQLKQFQDRLIKSWQQPKSSKIADRTAGRLDQKRP